MRETITTPSFSEAIVADEAQGAPTYTCPLVEPCLSYMSRKHVLLAKSVVDPSSCDIAVFDIEDDKSATTSHPETEGDESEIVGIPNRPRLSPHNRKPPTRFGWED